MEKLMDIQQQVGTPDPACCGTGILRACSAERDVSPHASLTVESPSRMKSLLRG